MTSDSERHLAGISIPQWMKSKITDRYDLEDNAFSPPTDDDFFLIRYPPKAKSLEPENKPKIINSTLTGGRHFTPFSHFVDLGDPSARNVSHTEPCQQFIPQAKITPREIGLRHNVDPPLGKVKSTGTDDGFKGEGAACGYSVVAVAQQMLEKSGDDVKIPARERTRRNSKSLPASPQTSPKLLRRNPYFTNILFGSTEGVDAKLALEKSGRLLSAAIESQRSSAEDLTTDRSPPPAFGRDMSTKENLTIKHLNNKALRAKPSQLREMNFWSPTSM